MALKNPNCQLRARTDFAFAMAEFLFAMYRAVDQPSQGGIWMAVNQLPTALSGRYPKRRA